MTEAPTCPPLNDGRTLHHAAPARVGELVTSFFDLCQKESITTPKRELSGREALLIRSGNAGRVCYLPRRPKLDWTNRLSCSCTSSVIPVNLIEMPKPGRRLTTIPLTASLLSFTQTMSFSRLFSLGRADISTKQPPTLRLVTSTRTCPSAPSID